MKIKEKEEKNVDQIAERGKKHEKEILGDKLGSGAHHLLKRTTNKKVCQRLGGYSSIISVLPFLNASVRNQNSLL